MPSPQVDFLYGSNAGQGPVADLLLANNMDPNVLRPWTDRWGRTCVNWYNPVTRKVETRVVSNTPSTLYKDQWIQMDQAVVQAERAETKIWSRIRAEGLTYDIPNGMSVMVLQHQTAGNFGSASISYNGLREGYRDRPEYDLGGIPLPIIHADFSFDARELAVARRSGQPLDTSAITENTNRCIELVEKITIGTVVAPSYAGYSINGLTTHSQRIAKTFTLPTDAAWTPQTLLDEMLDAFQSLSDVGFNGPFGVWYSPAWGKYMNNLFSSAYNAGTLMQNLRQFTDVKWWEKADYLGSGFVILIVSLDPTTIQAVQGMKMTVLQWDMAGGMEKKFKIMCIRVPRIRPKVYTNAAGSTVTNVGVAHCVAT